MRRKRRSRKNAWFGKPRLHSKAARKGHRRSRGSRRTRRNAGAMSIVNNTTRSLRAGFDPKIIKTASAILLGNISTTWYVDQIASRVHMLRTNPVLEVGSLLLLGGANALFVGKVLKQPKYAKDILIGGILAGVTRAVKMVLPGHFATCGLGEGEGFMGLGEEMDGLGSYYASPGNLVVTPNGHFQGQLNQPGRYPHAHMRGFGAYASPSAVGIAGLGWAPGPSMPTIGTHGMDDYAPPTMPFHPALARTAIHIDHPHTNNIAHNAHAMTHPAMMHPMHAVAQMHGMAELANELADQM